MKIAKILTPYFKISMIRIDDKRIKVFQVNVDNIKPKLKVSKVIEINEDEIDEFEDVESNE
jgi:ribosomal protein S7